MKKIKILHTEYGSYNDDVIQFLIRRLKEKKNGLLLDPMAGTAPLIPFIENNGYRAYFNDIMPLHYFVNKAKTYDIYYNYQKNGKQWYQQELEKCMESLKNKKSVISNEIIHNEVLISLKEAWKSIGEYEECQSILLRALLLLCIRPFSSSILSKNSTWIKKGGGISSKKDLSEIISESIGLYDNYYRNSYKSDSITNKGKCIFSKKDVLDFTIQEKVDFIFTSPWYPNRLDPIALYRPETIFLSSLGFNFPEYSQVSTPRVREYTDYEADYDFLTTNSRFAYKILTRIKDISEKKDSSYYIKYFTRYFAILFRIIIKTTEHLSSNGKMYIILQDNMHRGVLIEIHKILGELLKAYGWNSHIAKKFERHHLGLRNVSREYAFVKPKHFEKIMRVTL